MNKFLSKIISHKELAIKVFLLICDTFISIMSIYLIPNKLISVLYILGIFIINFIAVYKNKWPNLNTSNLFNRRSKIAFSLFLLLFAFVPTLAGTILKEAEFLKLLFSNLIPNILGALIVCSFIDHMSRFHYSNLISHILQKDYFIESIVKIFYYFCFFNSANYYLDENWNCTNAINNFYLFVVILSGLLVGASFFYRLFIDDEPFDFTPKEIYPIKVLVCGTLYLISCAVPSYIKSWFAALYI